MAENTIQTRTGKIWLLNDGILRQECVPNTELTLQDAQELITAHVKLSNGKPRPVLIYMRGVKSVTREARQYFGESLTRQYMSAVALLANSAVTKVIGSFFLRFHKTDSPVKLFGSETEALKWLKGFL